MPLQTLAFTNSTNNCELLITAPSGSDADYTIFGS